MNGQDLQTTPAVVVFCTRENDSFTSDLAGFDGIRVEVDWDLRTAADLILEARPDVVALRNDDDGHLAAFDLIRECRRTRTGPRPVWYLVLDDDPGQEVRQQARKEGFSACLTLPVSGEAFRVITSLSLEAVDARRNLSWTSKRLERAMAYLDRFKERLVKTRKAYAQEKSILHNALKQINAMAQERDRLKLEIRETGASLKMTVASMEAFLEKMIEARSEADRGHSERVAGIAGFAAEKLGFDETDQDLIKRAARLHEVGRLLIPDSVQARDLRERSEIETRMFDHEPSRGADLLALCPGLERVALIIRHINEHVDGSGTPDGLKRRQIPLASRIIAGADRLDRLWQSGTFSDIESLCARLDADSGFWLDPRVVSCLERYVALHLAGPAERLRELGVYQLEPGMETGAGLYTATGTKLFSAGTVLTREAIEKLVRYNREYPIQETVFIKAG